MASLAPGVRQVRSIRWADAALSRIAVDYDSVTLDIREDSGRQLTVRCDGHIGCELSGFWDETIIETAEVLTDDPYIEHCIRAIKARYKGDMPETGSSARNGRLWNILRVRLIDGCELRIVFAKLRVNTP